MSEVYVRESSCKTKQCMEKPTSNTNSHHEAPAEYPSHLQCGSRNTVGQADAHDDPKDPDDEFIAVNKSAAEDIA